MAARIGRALGPEGLTAERGVLSSPTIEHRLRLRPKPNFAVRKNIERSVIGSELVVWLSTIKHWYVDLIFTNLLLDQTSNIVQWQSGEGKPVEVDQGALIRKVLARYPGDFTCKRDICLLENPSF